MAHCEVHHPNHSAYRSLFDDACGKYFILTNRRSQRTFISSWGISQDYKNQFNVSEKFPEFFRATGVSSLQNLKIAAVTNDQSRGDLGGPVIFQPFFPINFFFGAPVTRVYNFEEKK